MKGILAGEFTALKVKFIYLNPILILQDGFGVAQEILNPRSKHSKTMLTRAQQLYRLRLSSHFKNSLLWIGRKYGHRVSLMNVAVKHVKKNQSMAAIFMRVCI